MPLGKPPVKAPDPAPQLEPAFPYVNLPFDFAFFGVDRDPDPEDRSL
jgi:hypothetical protein